jgi:hypothetical protein
MGALHPQISQIREDCLDFIIEYFSDCPTPSDTDAYLKRFVDSFLGRFPDAAASRRGEPDSKRLASFIVQMKECYTYVDGRPMMPLGGPEWLESAAFRAILACGAHEIRVGAILAEDVFVKTFGDLWRHLDGVCTDRDERAAAIALRKLMLDRRYEDRRLLNSVQANIHFLALLRPNEVRLLHGSIPLLERFHAAVPRSTDRFRMADLFREDLQRLTDYLASVDATDVCLFSQSLTS